MMDSIYSNPSAGEASSNDLMNNFATRLPGIPSLGRHGEPTAEDMEKAMESVRFSKLVKCNDVGVGTFDLSVPAQVEEYKRVYKDLYAKGQLGQALIITNEKKFVDCRTNLRWLVHLQWLEYELEVTDHMNKTGVTPNE